MTEILIGLVVLVTGIFCGFLATRLSMRQWQRHQSEEAQRVLIAAQKEAELAAREIRSHVEIELERRRQELDQESNRRRMELDLRERSIQASELVRENKQEALANREQSLERRAENLDQRRAELEKLIQEYRQRLQSFNGNNLESARENLLKEVRRECEDELREYKKEILGRTEQEIQQEARRTLIVAMQRLATVPQHDVNATVVTLPGEDMKGRIIGREGRNIKSFESATGTTLLIDETPNSVLVSSFDPVRREIARIALERLIKDGRIHPGSIEEFVEQAGKDVRQSVTEFGEDALRRLRLNQVHPEVVTLLGKLRYRLSNNQNSLEHSIEVANLCALMAAELGLQTEPAKRAGLFHDIGKTLDPEYEGSHAIAGANLLKRVGEDPIVVNAVAAHHEECPEESPYAPLVKIADTLSAMRPGARADSIDSYIQRVRNLEELARQMNGVADAFAIHAGREIRVIVEPERLNDDQARKVARDLRRRIEEELQYPGTIKVTVIRERRFSEQAK